MTINYCESGDWCFLDVFFFIGSTKQDKLHTDLIHINQEHSIESREDCRQMVMIYLSNKIAYNVLNTNVRWTLNAVSVCRSERIHRPLTCDQKTNDKHSSKSETVEGNGYVNVWTSFLMRLNFFFCPLETCHCLEEFRCAWVQRNTSTAAKWRGANCKLHYVHAE